MKINIKFPKLKVGEIPDGTIVKIWFRFAISGRFDWAIYEVLEEL